MSHKNNDILTDELLEWLAEIPAQVEDIQYDSEAKRHYVIEEVEGEMTEDGLTTWSQKTYLPANFESII